LIAFRTFSSRFFFGYFEPSDGILVLRPAKN
jgi:hypothetical protein